MLQNRYPNGIPAEQQAALSDHVITRDEMAAAAAARNVFIAAIPSVVWVEPFAWTDDLNFAGGAYQVTPGVEEGDVQPDADACYYRYVALIETAWLDQQWFGDWTDKNLLE